MEIKQLLELYFEGLTTSEQEAALRRFFMSGEAPEELRIYRPLFVYFDAEIKATKPVRRRRPNNRLYLWLSGVAACTALLIGSLTISLQRTGCPPDSNYVMINGRCYTDDATIRAETMKSLHSVQEDGFLTTDDHPANVNEIIENQLKDFQFLIDE